MCVLDWASMANMAYYIGVVVRNLILTMSFLSSSQTLDIMFITTV
jgi:hypothetical protein